MHILPYYFFVLISCKSLDNIYVATPANANLLAYLYIHGNSYEIVVASATTVTGISTRFNDVISFGAPSLQILFDSSAR